MKKNPVLILILGLLLVGFCLTSFAYGGRFTPDRIVFKIHSFSSMQTSKNTTCCIMQKINIQYLDYKNNIPSSVLYSNEQEIEIELEEVVAEQIEFLDLTEIQKVIDDLTQEGKEVFGDSTIENKLQKILSGDFRILGDNAFESFLNFFFDSFISLVPLMASIIAVGILSGMLNQVRSKDSSKGIGDIIHFVCYGLILVLVVSSVYQLLQQTSNTLSMIKSQIDAVFPVLLTLLTAVGGNVSVGVYQPAIALLSGSILQIFNSVLVPIFIFVLYFSLFSILQ